MLHKKFTRDSANLIFKQKLDSCEIKNFFKVCLRFKFLKTFKAVPKNNPWMHSTQQNKKAVMTAAYVKVSTPVRSER